LSENADIGRRLDSLDRRMASLERRQAVFEERLDALVDRISNLETITHQSDALLQRIAAKIEV
jgi:uncharacterized coiled-coil protein SlyX